MPVANQREDEQQKGDQQQSGRLRCIDRVAALVVRVALGFRGRNADLWGRHADIVALGNKFRLRPWAPDRDSRGGRL